MNKKSRILNKRINYLLKGVKGIYICESYFVYRNNVRGFYAMFGTKDIDYITFEWANKKWSFMKEIKTKLIEAIENDGTDIYTPFIETKGKMV